MICSCASRFASILFVLFVIGLCFPTHGSASTVSFQVVGTADLTLNGTFHSGEDFEIMISVDDEEPDQFALDSTRGAFRNVTTLISLEDTGLAVQNAVALNIDGLRQDQFPESLYLADSSNFFNQGFSAILPAGTLLDVNQIHPFVNGGVNATSTGAGLIWELPGGQTVQFNQVTSIALSNPTVSVPEPNRMLSILIGLVGLTTGLRKRRVA